MLKKIIDTDSHNVVMASIGSGATKTGAYKPAAQIDITTAPINTGLNLNDADFLFIQFKDSRAGIPFGVQMYDLAAIRAYGNNFKVWNYKDAYMEGTITDYATGTFTINLTETSSSPCSRCC